MIWKNRIVSALCAIVIAGAVGFAVVKLSPPAAPQPETPAPTETAAPERGGTYLSPEGYEVVHEGLTYRVTGVADDAQVLRVGDNTAPADLFTYWLGNDYSYWNQVMQMYTGSELDLNGTMGNGQSVHDFLYEDTTRAIQQELVLENLAKEYGIDISDEAAQEIEETRQTYMDYFGGAEGYRAELSKLGVSEATYERVRRSDYLYSALYELFLTEGSRLSVSEEELLDYAEELGYITADHILLKTINDDGSPMDETAAAEVRAQIEDLLAQLRESDEMETLFAALADEYSEDPGRETNPNGYTFTSGEMVEPFENAAYALAPGELSDVVETDYGFHILLRRELDAEAALDTVRTEYFEKLITERIEAEEIEIDPAISSADVGAIFEELMKVQSAGAENR